VPPADDKISTVPVAENATVAVPDTTTVAVPDITAVDVPDIATVDVAVNFTLAGLAPVNVSPAEL
jgi:hypothetical protein